MVCAIAPHLVSPAPMRREMGDGALGEGEQAAGLRRDEEFPWQPLLARRQGSSANSPGAIPVDLEA